MARLKKNPDGIVVVKPENSRRDERGLLKNVEHKFLEDGSVDWRGMLRAEHLAFNRQAETEIEKKYGKPLKELDITSVEDKYILILLAGIKHLARLRGYLSVSPKVEESNSQNCVVNTTIKWIGNYETDFRELEFGSIGSASIANTFDFGQRYLPAMAENRAFCRSVRLFLGINIVAYDEIGPKVAQQQEPPTSSGAKPFNHLEDILSSLGLSFDKFKEGYLKKYYTGDTKVESDPAKWTQCKDIPPNDIYILLSILKKD